MKLKDYMKKVDKDMLIYLGTGSSFVFIGYKNEFSKDEEMINKHIENSLKLRINQCKSFLKNVPSRINQLEMERELLTNNEAYIDDWKNHLKEATPTLSDEELNKMQLENIEKISEEIIILKHREVKKKKELPMLKEKLVNLQPLSEREVTGTHERTVYDKGIIINIEGDEIGEHWFKYEYEEWKEQKGSKNDR